MGDILVKQPNEKYAIFSTVVDDFMGIDMDKKEVEDFYIEEMAVTTRRKVKTALENADLYMQDYYISPASTNLMLSPWEECIETVRLRHGDARVELIERAIASEDYTAWLGD